MTKKEIIATTAKEMGCSEQKATRVVNIILNAISRALDRKEDVTIEDFGKFFVKHISQRKATKEQTKEMVVVPEHDKVAFKAYRNLLTHFQIYG